MKLLSKTEVQNKKVMEQVTAAKLTNELEGRINELKAELNRIQDQFNEKIIALDKDYDEFCLFNKERKAVISREIENLETKRASLLKPIETTLEQAEKIKKENENEKALLSNRESVLAEKEKEVSEELEKIDDIRDSIIEVRDYLKTREEGIKRNEKVLKASTEDLNKRWSDYHLTVARKMQEFLERDERLVADNAALSVLREETEQDKKWIEREKRLIQDRKEMLKRTEQRLKK